MPPARLKEVMGTSQPNKTVSRLSLFEQQQLKKQAQQNGKSSAANGTQQNGVSSTSNWINGSNAPNGNSAANENTQNANYQYAPPERVDEQKGPFTEWLAQEFEVGAGCARIAKIL